MNQMLQFSCDCRYYFLQIFLAFRYDQNDVFVPMSIDNSHTIHQKRQPSPGLKAANLESRPLSNTRMRHGSSPMRRSPSMEFRGGRVGSGMEIERRGPTSPLPFRKILFFVYILLVKIFSLFLDLKL